MMLHMERRAEPVQEESPRQVLGRNIRRRRRLLDLTQEQCAERCGLHRTYYAGVERGQRNPSFDILVKIARALEATPSQLVEGV